LAASVLSPAPVPTENPSTPLAMANTMPEPMMAPTTWATMYTTASRASMRLAVSTPSVIAGLKWPPEMWPRA
jgi:hypothetical protein